METPSFFCSRFFPREYRTDRVEVTFIKSKTAPDNAGLPTLNTTEGRRDIGCYHIWRLFRFSFEYF